MADERIRRAIEKNLSGMHVRMKSSELIMDRIHGGAKVKRKMSVAMVLAIVLILAAMTALAAITLNSYYEKVIEKEGEYGLIQDWPASDKMALVNWMIEAGAELDTVQIEKLSSAGLSEEEKGIVAMEIISSYYPARDSILSPVDIIAKEKGPFETWSLEDKAWFSEMLMQYQPEEVSAMHLLPSADDITQQQAIDIMYAYYEKEYGILREDIDETKMTISFAEVTQDDGSGPERVKIWGMDIWLKGDPIPMGISIRTDGTIDQAYGPYVVTWRDDWYDTYTSDDFWTVEGLYRFEQEWKPRFQQLLANGEEVSQDVLYLLEKNFGLPRESDLTRDEAFAIAKGVVLKIPHWTEERLSCYGTREAYLEESSGQNKYHFVFTYWMFPMASEERQKAEEWHSAGELPHKVIVQVDARSGEILENREDNNLDGVYRLGI